MPSDEDVPLGIIISQLYRLIVARSTKMLRAHGLSVAEMACLAMLHEQPGVSNAEIAAQLHVTPQAISIVQRSLVDHGLIVRSRNRTDGRIRTAELTAKGLELFQSADAELRVDDARILATLPAEDRTRALQLLQQIVASMEQ